MRAPFDGLVTERLTDPGNLAAPGVPLLRIESDGARQVVVRVDEARAAYVHAGDRVIVLIDAAAEQGADDKGLEGVVAEVARAVGADQRAFTVKVSLPSTVTARTAALPASSSAARLAVPCSFRHTRFSGTARCCRSMWCRTAWRGCASFAWALHRQKASRCSPASTPVNRLSSRH